MDEPTNHLDIEMREALAMALQTFEGAILIVSHDRHLLKSTVDEYWLVDNGKVASFDGDLEDYHQYTQNKEKQQESADTEVKQPSIDRKEQKRLEAEKRQRLAPIRKQQQAAEKKMEKLQGQLDEIEEKMADPSMYDDENKKELSHLIQQQGQLKSDLEEIEMEWMELTELLES